MNYKFLDYENELAPANEYKKKYRDKTPVHSAEAAFSGYNQIEKNERMFAYERENPATFINRPLTRG